MSSRSILTEPTLWPTRICFSPCTTRRVFVTINDRWTSAFICPFIKTTTNMSSPRRRQVGRFVSTMYILVPVRCFFYYSSAAHFTAETEKSGDEGMKAVIELVFSSLVRQKSRREEKKVIRCIHRVTPAIVDRSLMERGKEREKEIETKRKKRFVSRQRKF